MRTVRLTLRSMALALLLPALPAAAQAPASPGPERFRLENGLDVILLPDRATQVVAVEVWYEAGSRHDPRGQAGLARLFEQLMFAGSPNVPRGGHARIVEDAGGRLVAEVDEEVARFGQVLPSSRLSLGLWLEAERMRGVAVNDSLFAAIIPSRLGQLAGEVEREPYRNALVQGIAGVYDSTSCAAPYIRPPAETIAGTAALRPADAAAFFAARYRPSNARLVVAGDFDPAAARALVTEYFGGIPAAPAPPASPCTEAAPGRTGRVERIERAADQPAAGLFLPLPPHDHADTPALELIEIILARGRFARIPQAMAAGDPVALGWQAGTLGLRRAPGVFGFFGVAGPGVSADSLAAFFAAQARWVASGGPTEADLARAKEIHRATLASATERPGDIGRAALHTLTYHPAARFGDVPEAAAGAVTLQDLHRVGQTYFAPDRSLTLVVAPGGNE